MLKQATALEVSESCWILSIHVLKSSGILLNVKEQTTAFIILAKFHFFQESMGHLRFQGFFYSVDLISKTRGHCLWVIDRELIKRQIQKFLLVKVFFVFVFVFFLISQSLNCHQLWELKTVRHLRCISGFCLIFLLCVMQHIKALLIYQWASNRQTLWEAVISVIKAGALRKGRCPKADSEFPEDRT